MQHIYDSHYEGAERAADNVHHWKLLRGRIDEQRYSDILARLQFQAVHAIVLRDYVFDLVFWAFGIPVAHHPLGNLSKALEAKTMQLSGYPIADVVPWERASGGQ